MKELTLEDVCQKITDGAHFSPKACEDGKFPMFSVKDMQEYGFSYENCKYVSDEDYQKLLNSGCVPEVGDVLVAKDGSYLKHIFVVNERREEAILSSIAIFRPNELILSEYLLYVLKNPVMKRIISDNYVSGSALPRIVLKDFRKIKLKVPGLDIQQKVVSILGSIDKKIDLNNKLNANLEELMKAQFVKEFVTNNSINYMKSLYDMADFINGAAFKKDEYAQEGLPIIKIAELKNGVTDSTQYFNGKKDDKYFIYDREILFSWSGNPDTSIDTFIWTGGEAILNQHTFRVLPKDNEEVYIYLLLKYHKPIFAEIARNKQTTGLGHVTVADLKRLTFAYDESKIKEFCIRMQPVYDRFILSMFENKKLSSIRDTLLPRLMLGQVELGDVTLEI